MSYLLTFHEKETGVARHTRVPDRVAWFAAEEVLNKGHRLLSIQNAQGSEPLSIAQVEQTRAAKADWRKAYGRDIYDAEEAWYRKELQRG